MAQGVGQHAASPSNYIPGGKGVLLFKPDGESSYYHIGNCPAFSIQPNVDLLEHFSDMGSEAVKDDTVIRTKSGEIKFTMEEFTAKNLAMLLLGDVNEDDYVESEEDPHLMVTRIDLFSRTSFTGALRFYSTHGRGPRWFFDIPRVTINPSGAFNAIGRDYANMEVTGSWEAVGSDFGTAQLMKPFGTISPHNVLLPFIMADDGAVEDEELEANYGAWLDASSIAYVWKRDNVAIVGATAKTYTLVTADVATSITVTITATNGTGSNSKTTAAVGPVTGA